MNVSHIPLLITNDHNACQKRRSKQGTSDGSVFDLGRGTARDAPERGGAGHYRGREARDQQQQRKQEPTSRHDLGVAS